MGVVYSHSEKEERKLQKIIHEKKYYTFHSSFVDEKGNSTNGDVKQIIFGSDKLKKKSLADIFTGKTRSFIDSLMRVKRLLDLYPIFYELYEKNKIERYMDVLKIKNVNQIDDVLKQSLKGVTLVQTPITNLDKLINIASLKRGEELVALSKKTGKSSFSNLPSTTLDNITFQNISDSLFLSDEPEFLNEMILVYLVTIFKEYLKSNIEAIFTICPEIKESSETEIPNGLIPDGYDIILKIFKNDLKFDLETQVSEWKVIEEKLLRRNQLIHENGIPNDNYNKKTDNVGYSRLNTDTNYIKDTLKAFEKSRIPINNYMWKHHVNPKFLVQMSSEDIL